MSEVQNHRPYTVGVSIAAGLIFLITIFHIWKFVIRKLCDSPEAVGLEAVETEIALPERKLSSLCIQQHEMVLHYDCEMVQVDVDKKRILISRSLSGKKINRSHNLKRENESCAVTFFAGYSHQYVNEA